MKKLLLLLVMMMLPLVATAYDAFINGIYYDFNTIDKTAKVVCRDELNNADAYSGIVNIPKEIEYNDDTYIVTSILKAFIDCSELQTVYLPSSVSEIGSSSFERCTKMDHIYIPGSVISIGEAAFSNCTALEQVEMHSAYNLSTIGRYAFYNCNKLNSIWIPRSVSSIGYEAFGMCYNLKSVNITDVEAWCRIIFEDECSNPLVFGGHLCLPHEDEEVYELITPSSITSIDNFAFIGCKSVAHVKIGDNVTSIGESAFKQCNNMITLSLGTSVKFIGRRAFYVCSKLKSVIIPDGVSSIEDNTFDNCHALTLVSLPNSIKSIGNEAFYHCENLKSITIPKSVSNIGVGAFDNCSSLTSVTVEIASPINIGGATFSNRRNATLYVPAGSKAAYEAADYWKEFKEIVSLPRDSYTLTYLVDGETHKAITYDYDEEITPEPAPTKEGYTFSGWSEIPEKMPAKDVTVTGTFAINKYKLNYLVDGEKYKSFELDYGAAITPEPAPTKEGYTFSGWSEIPEKMPAEDVTITGTFTQIAEIIDGLTYQINDDEISVAIVGNIGNVNGALKIEATVTIHGKLYMVTAISEGTFQGCTGITSLELPASIVTIGKNTFEGCAGLRLIKLGRAIKEIGSMAFANIFKKKSKARGATNEEGLHLYCEAEAIPVTATDAFEGSDISSVTLHVAYDLVEKYRTTAPWNDFKEIIAIGAGDANGDGKVTDEDVLEIEDYIMGKPSGKFIFQNADINVDKKVNATDIVTVLNIILNNK